MRILFVASTYYPHINGVYYFVCRIGRLLKANGHQTAVIAPSTSTSATFSKVDDIDVYGIPSLPAIINKSVRIPFPFLLKGAVQKAIKEFKPDLVHIQDHFPISNAAVTIY